MNGIGILFVLLCSVLIFVLPIRLAFLPLLMSVTWMTEGQTLEIGSANFTTLRILVALGLLRCCLRGESLAHGVQPLDRWLSVFGAWMIVSAIFHRYESWVFRAGIVWNEIGAYFLLRCFVRDVEGIERIFKAVCLMLLPVAVFMIYEKFSGHNLFGILGGVNEIAAVRQGKIRASGPFVHPILAGTVGALCVIVALALWKRSAVFSVIGILAGGGVLFACTSSGPLLMLMFGMVSLLLLWRQRFRLKILRWVAFFFLLILNAMMRDPVYFLMARIDLSGGSQGWFRAELIRSTIAHLDEWWLVGTDFTRHWMPTGIYANQRHTDMVNHFIWIGVMGGLPLILIFCTALLVAFRRVGKTISLSRSPTDGSTVSWFAWVLGCALFASIVNFLSIALFDQSVLFFYLIFACIAALPATLHAQAVIASDRQPGPSSLPALPLASLAAYPRNAYERHLSHRS